MKIFLLILTLLFVGTVSSQNRYSTVSTSSYQPMPAPSGDYYRAMAERKMNEIGRKYQFYTEKVKEYMQLNTDEQFRTDLYEVQSYLNSLAGQLSLDEADWYIKKVEKLFNKAVRKYNKRIKKQK